eukprot:TRINITY_DN12338_c0_g1_i1.p1 TRINITY_DN12338_c0_g1~~TRINITY_DN12338_c0_g1_i1.p1  ORF type:complete len:117 (+),score=29.40 TRINITY_DN12338_c0_g1_i1:66-416(+)
MCIRDRSNVDGRQRYFSQYFAGDMYVVKESTQKPCIQERGSLLNDLFGLGGKKELYGGLSDYHNKNGYELKVNPGEPKRIAPAGHRDQITDILMIESETTPYIVSASRDHTIKVWR